MAEYALQHPYPTFFGFCFTVLIVGIVTESIVSMVTSKK